MNPVLIPAPSIMSEGPATRMERVAPAPLMLEFSSNQDCRCDKEAFEHQGESSLTGLSPSERACALVQCLFCFPCYAQQKSSEWRADNQTFTASEVDDLNQAFRTFRQGHKADYVERIQALSILLKYLDKAGCVGHSSSYSQYIFDPCCPQTLPGETPGSLRLQMLNIIKHAVHDLPPIVKAFFAQKSSPELPPCQLLDTTERVRTFSALFQSTYKTSFRFQAETLKAKGNTSKAKRNTSPQPDVMRMLAASANITPFDMLSNAQNRIDTFTAVWEPLSTDMKRRIADAVRSQQIEMAPEIKVLVQKASPRRAF